MTKRKSPAQKPAQEMNLHLDDKILPQPGPVAREMNVHVDSKPFKLVETWQAHGRTFVAAMAVLTALILAWGYAQALFESGPLPVPSRAELKLLDQKIEMTKAKTTATEAEIVNRIQALDTRSFILLADTLTYRQRNLQAILDQASIAYDKDPTATNQRVLETLQIQLDDVNRQIKSLSDANAAVPAR